MACWGCDDDQKEEDIDGVCPECGTATIQGVPFRSCSYSEVVCNVCGYSPCDGSC